MTVNKRQHFLWGLTLRDGVLLAMISAATAAAKLALKIPLGVPGHFSLVWMFFLVLGCALVPKKGAGTTLGILTGVMAVMLGFGHDGFMSFLKWFAAGLTLEAFAIVKPDFARKHYLAVAAGGVSSGVKTVLGLALFYLVGFKGSSLETVGAVALALNILFGAAGGFLAWLAWRRVK